VESEAWRWRKLSILREVCEMGRGTRGELSFYRHPRENLHGYSDVRIAPEITVTDRRRCAIEAGNALALATSIHVVSE
jgi:hypothetical protein